MAFLEQFSMTASGKIQKYKLRVSWRRNSFPRPQSTVVPAVREAALKAGRRPICVMYGA